MKRLLCKTGEYQKDGQTKGEYTKLGVMMPGNEGGEFLLLDPTISLAGVLAKQNAFAATQNKPIRDTIMVSVFEEQQQGQQQNSQQNNGYQQQAPQQQQQNNNQGYQQNQNYQNNGGPDF